MSSEDGTAAFTAFGCEFDFEPVLPRSQRKGAEAIGNLPDLSAAYQEQQKAAGADDATANENALALRLALGCEKQRVRANGSERKCAAGIKKTNCAKQG